MRFTPDGYEARTGNKPQVDQTFLIDETFPGKVESVTDKEVIVRLSPESRKEVVTPFGRGTIRELLDGYEIVIDARPGSLVRSGGFIGRITNVDDREITVDYTNPFGRETLVCDVLVESIKSASQEKNSSQVPIRLLQDKAVPGKAIVLDVEVVSLEPPSSPASKQITWTEDYDAGLAEAKKEGKPAILLLHADWCSWCKKFQDETVQDPRIRAMQGRFVWIRVNSDKQKDFQTKYQQNGFPLILILASDGQVSRRIDGYVDAASFRETLGGQAENQSPKQS
jgi:hypothetical protein